MLSTQIERVVYMEIDALMRSCVCACDQMNDVHPYRFRLKTVDRVYRFAVDMSGRLFSYHQTLKYL